jgi:hypothetical protein
MDAESGTDPPVQRMLEISGRQPHGLPFMPGTLGQVGGKALGQVGGKAPGQGRFVDRHGFVSP